MTFFLTCGLLLLSRADRRWGVESRTMRAMSVLMPRDSAARNRDLFEKSIEAPYGRSVRSEDGLGRGKDCRVDDHRWSVGDV